MSDDGLTPGAIGLVMRPKKGAKLLPEADAIASMMKPALARHGTDGFETRALASIKPIAIDAEIAKALVAQYPEVDPGLLPLGQNVLVQIQKEQDKTASGLLDLPDEFKDHQKWNEQTGRVIALGPLAYRNPNDGQPFVEGDWCSPGDFVRVPKYGGDRHEVALPDGKKALFVVCKDREIISRITGNPLDFRIRL